MTSRLQEFGVRLKNPPQLQRNVRIRWSGCYLLLFVYCERTRNNPENHLQQKRFPIPLSGAPGATRTPFFGRSPSCKQRRFYHLSQMHFLAHFHFQTFPFSHRNKCSPNNSLQVPPHFLPGLLLPSLTSSIAGHRHC